MSNETATMEDLEKVIQGMEAESRGGMFPLPKIDRQYVAEPDTCRHPEHKPPSHIAIPEGYGYEHVCPRCGKTQIVKNEGPTFRG